MLTAHLKRERLVFFLFSVAFAFSQTVVINEFMSSNGNAAADEDGDFSDWVELYNAGLSEVNLAGWGISDDPANPFRWTFPDVTVEPGQHLLVWASGKDRKPTGSERVSGLVREVYFDIPGGSVEDLTNHASFPDGWTSRQLVTGSFEAPSNVAENYGQRMHGYIKPPVTGSYRFWLAGDNGSRLFLSTDDNPANMTAIAEIPGVSWSDPRQWNRFSEQQSDLIWLEAGRYYYICALMKEDVGGDHLCVRWQLPGGAIEEPIPGSRLFADPLQLHTNFAISSDGESVVLTQPDGTTADQTTEVALIGDVSYGRVADGGVAWAFFDASTPGQTNNGSVAYQGITPPVEFSQQSGFYTGAFDMSLANSDPQAQVYYTLDGSDPNPENLSPVSYTYKNDYSSGDLLTRTYQSFAYDGSITIDQRQVPFLSGIAGINTTASAPAAANWTIEGDEVVQNSLATNVRLMFGDPAWTDYEFTCQALKNGGSEGFLFFVRVDGSRFYLVNFGGWNNTLHGIEKGYDNGTWSIFVDRVNGSIATDQWYDIRIRCEGQRLRAWLNSTLVFDITDNSGSPWLSGGVGVGTWATQSRYRNMEIKSLDSTTLFSGIPTRTIDQTIVRARAYRPGYIPSVSTTRSYFVDPDVQQRHSVSVISLAVEEPDFFGFERGIYVAGTNYGSGGNFMLTGPAWERPVHIDFFEPDGTLGFAQNMGTRIHGGATRNHAQKALRLYARGDYGDTEVEYPVFPDISTDRFKRLLVRNSGNDWNNTMFRDAAMQKLVAHLPLDTQAYRPAVLYINGEYWGINNLRERFDKHYLERKYGLDPDKLDILEYLARMGPHLVKQGSSEHFDQTLSYIESNGLSDPADYAYIQTRIDTDNFRDYHIAQIYFNNTDWPANNNDWWRKQTDSYDPTAPYGHDGRWRWMLYDTDFGFGLSGGYTNDTLAFATSTTGPEWPNPPFSTFLFRKMLENETFRRDFINRYCDLLNTAFVPERVIGVIDTMQAAIADEIGRHAGRWGGPTNWPNNVQVMRTFAQQRPYHARAHLRSYFGLGDDRLLTLNVSDASHGHVRVNSTDITADTPGVDSQNPFPWSGTYFQSVPVSVTAIAAKGYRFTHWQAAGGTIYTQPTLLLPMTSNISLTAYFEEAPAVLIHYWSFNNGTALLPPTFTAGGGQLDILPGEQTEVESDDGQDFAGLNNRVGEPTGTHLRLNYPIGSSLVLSVPTTGYESVVMQYETRRSGSGAGQQTISCSTDGSTFTAFETINVYDDDPVLYTFDFSGIAGVNDNPQFKVKIEFAQGLGSTAGNNRIDNLTVDSVPLAGTNLPPRVTESIGPREMIEGAALEIGLEPFFSDDDPLIYTVTVDKPFAAQAAIDGSVLTLSAQAAGEAEVIIQADDGVNAPARLAFRVLVYPQARPVRLGVLRFGAWSADAPENTYPDGFLFLQSDVSDPRLDEPLDRAYFIPHDDYTAGDQAIIGFPYKATSRTRINGLGEDGIAFINSGRERDLGGALTAVDTRGVDSVRVSWTTGTILRNSRLYAIRLQYRIGHTGAFADVLSGGVPVEYMAQYDGHTQTMGPVELPAEAMDQPYVQLLWRYYYLEGTGSRPQLRLDDIAVSGILDVFQDISLFAQWWLRTDCTPVDYCGGADFTQDGRVDLDDFAILAGQWMNENAL